MLDAIILLSGVLIGALLMWAALKLDVIGPLQEQHDAAMRELNAFYRGAPKPHGKHDFGAANSSGVHPAMTRKVYGVSATDRSVKGGNPTG